MAWQVYILSCRDASLYTGVTNDLAKRLRAHRGGKGAAYTRSRLPVEVVFLEDALDRSAALRREAGIKQLTRSAKLELVSRGAGGERQRRRRKRGEHSAENQRRDHQGHQPVALPVLELGEGVEQDIAGDQQHHHQRPGAAAKRVQKNRRRRQGRDHRRQQG